MWVRWDVCPWRKWTTKARIDRLDNSLVNYYNPPQKRCVRKCAFDEFRGRYCSHLNEIFDHLHYYYLFTILLFIDENCFVFICISTEYGGLNMFNEPDAFSMNEPGEEWPLKRRKRKGGKSAFFPTTCHRVNNARDWEEVWCRPAGRKYFCNKTKQQKRVVELLLR
jgi:hypothetical protein